MKIKLYNGVELEASGMFGRNYFYQGMNRDSLVFLFDPENVSFDLIRYALPLPPKIAGKFFSLTRKKRFCMNITRSGWKSVSVSRNECSQATLSRTQRKVFL